MDSPSATYLAALEAAKKELVEITTFQELLEKRKIVLRKAIEGFSSLLEDERANADYLMGTPLPDEIKNIMKSRYPGWVTPHFVMSELKSMGRDLARYPNPQSAIQTILKRMAESDSDPTEETAQPDGKKTYRCPPLSHQLGEAYGIGSTLRIADSEVFAKYKNIFPEAAYPQPLLSGEAGTSIDRFIKKRDKK